jgi:hypothetical protein
MDSPAMRADNIDVAVPTNDGSKFDERWESERPALEQLTTKAAQPRETTRRVSSSAAVQWVFICASLMPKMMTELAKFVRVCSRPQIRPLRREQDAFYQ